MWKLNIAPKKYNNISLHPSGALNMNTTRAAEDTQHVEGVAKKKPDHIEEDYPNKIKCPNYQENHPFNNLQYI